MRKLALLAAGGALWLFVAALPVLADGGPHVLTNNNGTTGLAGDCASCHRAHTAQASSLLRSDMPGLCTNCHNGTKATTDVIDGLQYAPTGTVGVYGTTVLGALRGGGFDFALIDSGNPARLAYSSTRGTSETAHVGVLSAGVATTSQHDGIGTVWGNGATTNGVGSSVTLECASCHNPHGNGQYRILQTTPGSTTWTGFSDTNAVGVQVQEATPATLAATDVRNYTVRPSSNGLTTGIVGTASQGDYWRYKYDSSGVTNWLTTSNVPDPMNTGWQSYTASYVSGGATPVTNYMFRYPVNTGEIATYNAALIAAGKNDPVTNTAQITGLDNRGGLMTAWCIQCHTRYSGQRTVIGTAPNQSRSPSSLTAMDPAETTFMYKHGTTGVGCEQCHVSHGSNAQMTGPASTVEWPGQPAFSGTTPDSRLLKVNNRGTCQLCHDPTGTVTPGTYVGPTPTPGL